ncbi:type IV secretion protein Rhs [Fusobacterium nucleatum]|uniref:Type IV secretion protein Rhs n=2 Tax=Fusobacterium nucleatum subsp. polymorphum TaxID=76857 RepID=A0A2C6AWZ4_FUSNP|nr:type IV secretion protein Rhs [Fusobacterium polymorphum]
MNMSTMNKILGVDGMKKFLLLFTLMLLVFNYSYSVSKIMPENDWKVKKLKGKVKTMVSKIDEYDYSEKVENKIEIVTNFNENGYITEEVNYYNGDKKQTTTNKYNKDGLLIESKEVPGRKWEHTYKYDKNGNLVETKKPEIRTGADKKHLQYKENIYDKNGRIIEENWYVKEVGYEKDFVLSSSYTNVYDSKGLLIELRDNMIFSNSIKFTYEYDSKGGYLRTGLSTSRTIQQYFDKNGIEKETLSTSWISKDTEPRVDQHLKMETKLDGKGNIIEETEIRIEIINEKTREYKENGIRKKTVITYEYYE